MSTRKAASKKASTKKAGADEEEVEVSDTAGIYAPDAEDEDFVVRTAFRHPADWDKEYAVGDAVGTGDFTARQLQELKEAGQIMVKPAEEKASKK